jgi:sugar/nucleoside kinase (ribokinase family)
MNPPASGATSRPTHDLSTGRDVVVVGNIGIDTNVYLPSDSAASRLESTFTKNTDGIGQAGGSTAFGYAAFGLSTGIIAYVGEDPLGRWIRDELAGAEIDELLFTDPTGTSRSINLVSNDGSRKNFYDGKSHMQLGPDLEQCRAFLTGARLAHVHLPNWAREVLPIARELGLIIATDLQDMTSPDDAYRSDFIEGSDFLFCSAVNLEPRELGRAILARNPRAIVVFGMGPRGAGIHTEHGFREFPPVHLDQPVVDTNGAGDSLAVGFLAAHVFEGRPLEEALRWGQVAARWCCAQQETKWRRYIRRARLKELVGRS